MIRSLPALLPLLALAGVLLTLLLPRAARAEVGLLPPLEIARGLPSHARCKEAWDAARAEVRRQAAGLGGVSLAAERAERAWQLAWWAASPGGERFRREALRDLVELVGWRRVLSGDLPPPVPLSE